MLYGVYGITPHTIEFNVPNKKSHKQLQTGFSLHAHFDH